MTVIGLYGDERTYRLPPSWTPCREEVLFTALNATIAALDGSSAADRIRRYYDRASAFAGTAFLDAEPNSPFDIGASDLYAVTTLSMYLHPRQGRLLLEGGDERADVLRRLLGIDPDLPITDLEHGAGGSAETLQRMYEMQLRLRTLLGGDSNRWVFGAKLCARKRPRLFPVRDNLVCRYLAGGRTLRSGDGWPGDFSVDIQVYAYLATSRQVTSRLSWVRAEIESEGVRLDEEDLRLLDSALWMAAND